MNCILRVEFVTNVEKPPKSAFFKQKELKTLDNDNFVLKAFRIKKNWFEMICYVELFGEKGIPLQKEGMPL